MIQVRELTSHAEMVAAHKAIRARLWTKHQKPTIIEPTPEKEPSPEARRIKAVIRHPFDSHVAAYHVHQLMEIRAAEEQRVIASKPTIKEIVATLCAGTEYTYDDIIGKRRFKPLVQLRHFIICEVIRLRQDLSIAEVSRRFNLDHTSVINVVEKHGLRQQGLVREQQRRPDLKYLFDGKMLPTRDIAELCGINYRSLYDRIRNRNGLYGALAMPLKGRWIMYKDRPAYEAVGRDEPRQSA